MLISQKISYAFLILCIALVSSFSHAKNKMQPALFSPNLSIVETKDNEKIEIIKVFAYECRACKHFEIKFTEWLKAHSHQIVVRNIPVSVLPKNFQENLLNKERTKPILEEIGRLPRMFYSLMAIDKNIFKKHTTLNKKIFDQTLVGEKMVFNPTFLNEETQASFLEKEFGIKKEIFLNNFREKNFYIDTKARMDQKILKKNSIKAVPSIILSGKRLVTPNNSSESVEEMVEEMLKAINQFIKLENSALRN